MTWPRTEDGRVDFERIDAQLIAEGYPTECVTWVCDEHHRHCTHLDVEHTQHACIFCDGGFA